MHAGLYLEGGLGPLLILCLCLELGNNGLHGCVLFAKAPAAKDRKERKRKRLQFCMKNK